jgi:hypothetical protein
MSKEEAVLAIAGILRPFRKTNLDPDYFCTSDVDSDLRDIVRAALRRCDVYDAGGCPACLS